MSLKHPADMTADEFMALPVVLWPVQATPIRSKHDPLGFSDEQGNWWMPTPLEDGSWARLRLL